jgi:hypothetical protein
VLLSFKEFSREDYEELLRYAKEVDIPMTASAMDEVHKETLQAAPPPG